MLCHNLPISSSGYTIMGFNFSVNAQKSETGGKLKLLNVKNLQKPLANFKKDVIIWIVNNLQKMENMGERQRRKEDGKDSCSYGR